MLTNTDEAYLFAALALAVGLPALLTCLAALCRVHADARRDVEAYLELVHRIAHEEETRRRGLASPFLDDYRHLRDALRAHLEREGVLRRP